MLAALKKIFSEHIFFFTAIVLGSFFVVAVISPYLAEADFTDNDDIAAGFSGGTKTNLTWNVGNTWLEMDATGLSSGFATFTSRIVDTGGNTVWTGLSWVPEFPYLKELPNVEGVETAYTAGNISMTNNELLYHLNEISGSDITDASGNSLTGTVAGATITTNAKFNSAVTFDGTDDKITIPDNAALNMAGGNFSVGAWVNYTAAVHAATIVTISKSTYGTRFLLAQDESAGGTIMFAFEDTSGTGSLTCYYNAGNGFVDVGDGNWHHVVATRSGGTVTIYIDGISRSYTGPSAACINVADGNFIAEGAYGDFNGTLDEVAIWSKALSATEVLNMYKRGALRLKFQVQSCDDASCSGETFVGPNGASSFYTELTTSTLGLPSKTLMNISNNRYFQYRTIFETSSSTLSPYLNSVTLAGSIPGVTLTQSGGSTVISEAGTEDTYTLVLDSAPSSNVTITVSPDANSTVSTSSIVFTSSNWNTAVTVTSTAVNDSIAQGTHSSVITHSASSADSNYNNISISSVTATVTDNDTVGVTVTQSGGTTVATESGTEDTYTVVLTSAPTSTVTVALSISDSSQLSLSTSSIAFTSTTWNTAVTVTTTATNDSIAEGTHSVTISYTVTSSNWNYSGLSVTATSVSITDNDTAGITVTQSGGSTTVTEGGATDSFTIVLDSAPTSTVTIALVVTAQATISTSSIEFSSGNWDTPVTVTVTPVDDSSVEGSHTATISFTVTSSNWNYNAFALASVSVSITDNDTAAAESSQNTNTNSAPAAPPAPPQIPAIPIGPAPLGVVEVIPALGQPVAVSVGGESHTVTQVGVATNNQITIIIQSEPITLTLLRDKPQTVDSDKDGTADLRVVYQGLENGTPRLNIIALTSVGEASRPMSMNDGAYSTNSRDVTLKFNSIGAILLAVSENKNFLGASYIKYIPTLKWELSEGSGEKTLYVRFRSDSGGIVDSFDTIYFEPAGKMIPPSPITTQPTNSTPTITQIFQKPTFTKLLKFGSRGTQVVELQKILQKQGYMAPARPLGLFGPATRAAVKKFQKVNHIQPVGHVGPATRAALNRIIAK